MSSTPPAAQQGEPTLSWPSGGGTSSSSSSSGFSSPSSASSTPRLPGTGRDKDTAAGSSSSPSPPPSCAACRHQRRRCPPDCILKPYFLAEETDKFRNALRMFGVKNMHRILRDIPPPRRDACMRTIVYESNARWEDPVRGCCGVIQDLEDQLMDTAVELELLRRRLESYRRTATARGGSQPQPPPPNSRVHGQGPGATASPQALAVQQQQLMGTPRVGSQPPPPPNPRVAAAVSPLAVQQQQLMGTARVGSQPQPQPPPNPRVAAAASPLAVQQQQLTGRTRGDDVRRQQGPPRAADGRTVVELEDFLVRQLEAYQQMMRGGSQPPNPRGHGAAASPLVAEPQLVGRARGGDDHDVQAQPQGPYGATLPLAANGLAATQPVLFSAVQPQLSAVLRATSGATLPPAANGLAATQPVFSAARSPSSAASPPAVNGLAATQPQLSTMQPEFPAVPQPRPSTTATPPPPPQQQQGDQVQGQLAMLGQTARNEAAARRLDSGHAHAWGNDERDGRP